MSLIRIPRFLQAIIILIISAMNINIVWNVERIFALLLMLISSIIIFFSIFVIASAYCFLTTKGLEVRNLLTSEDFCNYEDLLIQHYFIVPENFNEDELMLEYRKRKSLPNIVNPLTHVNGYTILTTTQCNARCFYCYQHVTKHKSRMTKETAEKVANYIIDHTFIDEQVDLDWFGGEPLFNQEVIDIIVTKVEGSGRHVKSGIISNSYLFDEQTCIKAARDWHVQNI
jgi:sulfatase maturation enzyme AslB (radical SAM superfamily)